MHIRYEAGEFSGKAFALAQPEHDLPLRGWGKRLPGSRRAPSLIGARREAVLGYRWENMAWAALAASALVLLGVSFFC
jgi:hypothetical protein